MKKSLVLAMAMALGVTASAYAANPFSDVPAGHWAYDSIDKLAAAGVIEGMGDGTYQGDKTMTRYEMAQIVAKAMAKGANVDKLAAEFADELDNLGVRVANLEKKADNVKITGAINLYTRAGHGDTPKTYDYMLRSDITIAGQINSDWKYTALLRNQQQLTSTKGAGDETVNFQRAWVDGRVGGAKVRAGRWQKGMANKEIWNTRIDGVEVSYGKKIATTVGYAQLADASGIGTDTTAKFGKDAKVWYAEVKTKVAKVVGVEADYYAFKNMTKNVSGVAAKDANGDALNIAALTVSAPIVKNVGLTATGLKAFKASNFDLATAKDDKKTGYAVKLDYKGAKAAKPGSWGLYAKYTKLPGVINVNPTYTTQAQLSKAGFKGMQFGAQYVLAKNITGTVEWYDYKITSGAKKDNKEKTLFAGLTFVF